MFSGSLLVAVFLTSLLLDAATLQNVARLDVPGASNTFPLGINSHGDVVGYYDSNFDRTGFRYSPRSGMYTAIRIPGADAVYAGGITDSGTIVGTYSTQTIDNHFFVLFPDGQYVTFDYPATAPGYLSTFVSVNNRGDIAGSFGPRGEDYAGFIRSAEGSSYTTFRIAGAPETEVTGINDLGQVTGRYETSGGSSVGFIRNDDGSSVSFDTASLTLPRGINNNGEVVGTSGGIQPGFLRTADGLIVPLDVGGFATYPAAISASEQVTGSYFADNHYHGFVGLFAPVPEPGTFVSGLTGLVLVIFVFVVDRRKR